MMRNTIALEAPLLFLTFVTFATDGGKPLPVDVEASRSILAADLKRDLEYIASDALEGRGNGGEGQWKAGDYIMKEFEKLKLEPGGDQGYRQMVEMRGLRTPAPKSDTTETKPANPWVPKAANIIGILRGTDPGAGAIVFSAHYDHLGIGSPTRDGDRIYNGADDDGSGTVAVIALARAFAARKEKPKRTIVFACFTAEEVGGFGSKAYVKAPPVPLKNTICNINLEMLGRTHDVGPKRAWLTGWDFSTLGEILAKGASAAGVEVFKDPYPQQQFYMRSDNVAFVMNNVVGQTVSAGSTHPEYHTPDDEVDKIEFDNLEQLVRGIYLGSSLIATGTETPKPTGESLMPAPKPRKKPKEKPASSPAGKPAK